MRLLLTRQKDEIKPATYDALANNRNHWSIRALQAPLVNIRLFADFQMLYVWNEIDNRIFSDTGLNLSE